MLKKLSVLLVLTLSGLAAHAELIPGTTLSIDFQAAQIQGAGKKINMYRIPVTDTASGHVSYYDAVFDFNFANGQIVFDRTSFINSSTGQISSNENFLPGNYKDPRGNTYTVTGPATTSAGGRQTWSVASTTTGKVFDAMWATGLPTGNPLLSTALAAKCANYPGLSYGFSGGASYILGGGGYGSWNGAPIRASQVGNALTIQVVLSDCVFYDQVVLTKQ